MKRFLKWFLLIVSCLTLGLAAGCGNGTGKAPASSAPSNSKVIRVGMDAAYPPFGFQNTETKAYEGFDVDVIRAIGKAEGFETEVHNIAFDGLIPSLQSGVIDTAINDITITPDREKSVDFSKRYYIAGLGVVVKADNDAIGSTGEEAARKIEGANVKVYNTLSDAFLDLKQGAVDAVVNDIPTNEYYVAKTSDHSVKTAPVALTSEDLGIAVKKGNKDLLKKIDDGLAKIKKNGEFAAIYKKWFDREPPAELLK